MFGGMEIQQCLIQIKEKIMMHDFDPHFHYITHVTYREQIPARPIHLSPFFEEIPLRRSHETCHRLIETHPFDTETHRHFPQSLPPE